MVQEPPKTLMSSRVIRAGTCTASQDARTSTGSVKGSIMEVGLVDVEKGRGDVVEGPVEVGIEEDVLEGFQACFLKSDPKISGGFGCLLAVCKGVHG